MLFFKVRILFVNNQEFESLNLDLPRIFGGFKSKADLTGSLFSREKEKNKERAESTDPASRSLGRPGSEASSRRC
jgi:hypothetical protein